MQTVRILALCLVGLLAGGPVAAADFTKAIIAELQAEGYSRIQTDVTWLGRVRIVAENDSGSREIIVNPRTGEILRDLWLLLEGATAVSGGSRLIGGGAWGDDADDDDPYDDSDSGSDNSGSDDDGPDSDDSGSGDDDGSDG